MAGVEPGGYELGTDGGAAELDDEVVEVAEFFFGVAEALGQGGGEGFAFGTRPGGGTDGDAVLIPEIVHFGDEGGGDASTFAGGGLADGRWNGEGFGEVEDGFGESRQGDGAGVVQFAGGEVGFGGVFEVAGFFKGFVGGAGEDVQAAFEGIAQGAEGFGGAGDGGALNGPIGGQSGDI